MHIAQKASLGSLKINKSQCCWPLSVKQIWFFSLLNKKHMNVQSATNQPPIHHRVSQWPTGLRRISAASRGRWPSALRLLERLPRARLRGDVVSYTAEPWNCVEHGDFHQGKTGQIECDLGKMLFCLSQQSNTLFLNFVEFLRNICTYIYTYIHWSWTKNIKNTGHLDFLEFNFLSWKWRLLVRS